MLCVKEIHKTFNAGTVNEKKALNGLSLTLEEGDFVTVIGGNGAGKSTMLNAIAGVWTVDEGKITIDGIDVTRLPEHKRAKYLGRVFQDPMTGTAANMQIEENAALAARRGARRTLRIGITQEGAGRIQGQIKNTRSRTGKQNDEQGRTVIGWTETGADTADGNAAEAETAFTG